jgi:hypothetical protein
MHETLCTLETRPSPLPLPTHLHGETNDSCMHLSAQVGTSTGIIPGSRACCTLLLTLHLYLQCRGDDGINFALFYSTLVRD